MSLLEVRIVMFKKSRIVNVRPQSRLVISSAGILDSDSEVTPQSKHGLRVSLTIEGYRQARGDADGGLYRAATAEMIPDDPSFPEFPRFVTVNTVDKLRHSICLPLLSI